MAAATRNPYQGYSQLGSTMTPKFFSQLHSQAKRKITEDLTQFNQRELEILNLLGQGKSI